MKKRRKNVKRCPTCGRPHPGQFVRVCDKCDVLIGRHHKFVTKRKGRGFVFVHRNCKDPEAYS